ncbi:hypothetical protein Tco_0497095 [Tanacetum coccineum]
MERAAATASLEAEQDSVLRDPQHGHMANLEFRETHNMFWETVSASTSKNEEMEITATIDRRVKTITEASLRRHLKLEDADGISSLPNTKIFEQLALMSDQGSLTLNELTVLCATLSKKVEDLQNDLKQTKLTYGAAYTKLIPRVKKLEHKVQISKSRRRAIVIISDNKEDLEDSYKQGRIIAEIDQNPSILLVQDEGTSWIQEDTKIQTRTSADTEILLDQEEPTELVEDFGSGEKVSTDAENLVYIRRSAEKRKDKGKAIMKEDESIQKKIKKQLEQERLSHEAAIRLQE